MEKLPRVKHVHSVRVRLASGVVRRHHYVTRGGPRFWTTPDDGYDPVAYVEAYNAAKGSKPTTRRDSIGQLITAFLDSSEFKKLADRTRSDYRTWLERFGEKFSAAPVVVLQDRRFKADVAAWRDQWSHSPKQAQYAWTIVKRLASWAEDRGLITAHVIRGGTNLYKADRAELVWTPEDIAKILSTAPEWVRRIIIVATCTGLRAGDLCRLSRAHVRNDFVVIRTSKRQRATRIPVLPELREVIEATPPERQNILASERGLDLTPHRASEGVRQWGDKAGVNPDLTLNDTRGTVATRLVRAGVKMDDLAGYMAWSLRYANDVIENYVALDPKGGAEILKLLEGDEYGPVVKARARAARNDQHRERNEKL
ncbi:MAG: tyrosine-type recombinase/integrase [Pseudomonadota bacterium]